MAPKVKAAAQAQDGRRKAQKREEKQVPPSDVERLLRFLADAAEFHSESYGEDVRGMLQQGVAIGCAAEAQHQYVTDVENMVEDVIRDARQVAKNSLAQADDKLQTMDTELLSLKSSRESLAQEAVGARAELVARAEAYKAKEALVAQAVADRLITAHALADSRKAQQLVSQEKSSVEEAIQGAVRVLLDGMTEADTCKSKHIKTAVQLLKDVGAEPSLVASAPGALSVAAVDRTQWHTITLDAVKQLLEEAVVKLGVRVDAGARHFQASEAEDMGIAALIEHFNSQMLEACAQRNTAEQAADAADARLVEMDERLRELAGKASNLTSEQTIFKNKVDQVDAVLSSLEYVRGRHERKAAEEAEAKAQADAMAQAALTAAASPLKEAESSQAGVAMTLFEAGQEGEVETVGVVDNAIVSKLNSQSAVVCRVALGA